MEQYYSFGSINATRTEIDPISVRVLFVGKVFATFKLGLFCSGFKVFKFGFIGEFEVLLYGSLREGAGAEGD